MNLDTVIAERKNKTVYRDGNYAVKLFDISYSKSLVLNEALNQARVEETGLPIPRLISVSKIDGRWAIVLDYIEGKNLRQLMYENPDKIEEYLDLFISIQNEIHSKTAPLLTKLRDKMHRKIDESDFDATTRYDLHMRLDSMPKHNKVCHGDFCPSNIIITPEGKPYIIDWMHATQGNASADAARTYLLFSLYGNKEFADNYLHKFCQASDTPVQYVYKWLPIVAASQSVKGNPEEKEFLTKWVDVVEYE